MKRAFFCFLILHVSSTQLEPCECYSADGFTNKCHCEGNILSLQDELLDGDLYSL